MFDVLTLSQLMPVGRVAWHSTFLCHADLSFAGRKTSKFHEVITINREILDITITSIGCWRITARWHNVRAGAPLKRCKTCLCDPLLEWCFTLSDYSLPCCHAQPISSIVWIWISGYSVASCSYTTTVHTKNSSLSHDSDSCCQCPKTQNSVEQTSPDLWFKVIGLLEKFLHCFL